MVPTRIKKIFQQNEFHSIILSSLRKNLTKTPGISRVKDYCGSGLVRNIPALWIQIIFLDPVMYGIVEGKNQIETKPLFNLVFFQNGLYPDVNSKNTDQQEMLKSKAIF